MFIISRLFTFRTKRTMQRIKRTKIGQGKPSDFSSKTTRKALFATQKQLPGVTNPNCLVFFWKSPKNMFVFQEKFTCFARRCFFVFGSRFQNLMEMTSFHENFTQAKVDSSSLGGTGDPFGWIGWWKFWGCWILPPTQDGGKWRFSLVFAT